MAEKKNTAATPAAPAPHVATARRWRPQVFGDIVGQAHITTTLRNAVGAGRVGHAYLFSGPRGVGKTTTARILAKAINCLKPKDSDPDNACEICAEITEGRSVNVFEIDGASNRGVDEIRNLRDAVRYGPAKGKYKVYIIDEVHMLTGPAFNALLKTLEEPPSYVIFIFATTEVHKVPATILSRCQRFEFRRISSAEIVETLAAIAKTDRIDIDTETLDLIARKADGSLRDSQSIFDQVVAFCGGKIRVGEVRSLLKIVDDEFYFRVTDAIAARNAGEAFKIVDEVSRSGYDLREFAGGLAEHLRNLLVVRSTGDAELVDGSERVRKKCAAAAVKFGEEDILRLMKLASDTEAAMRWSQQPRLKLEIALQLMVALEPSVRLEQLLGGIEELKKKVESAGGMTARPSAAPPPATLPTQYGSPARREDPVPGAGGNLIPLKGKSPAPVRGTVKATQPTLRPDQYVQPPAASVIASFLPPDGAGVFARTAPAFTAPAAMVVPQDGALQDGVPDAPQSAPQPAPLSAADWSRNWPKIIDEVRKEKIAIGHLLAETSFHAANGTSVSIACPDDFHADLLKRNRQYISQLAERIYGARVQFESILAAAPPAVDDDRPGDGREPAGGRPPGGRAADPMKDNPLVQALVREFGAEEIH